MGQRSLLAERLRSRAPEIRQAILDRLHGMEGENPVRELDYLQALNEAVCKGVDYGIEVIAVGAERAAPAPLPLVTQARFAARHRIPHELVLHRYMTSKLVLNRFLLEEAAAMPGFEQATLGKALACQASAFEQLIAVVSDEYRREMTTVSISSQEDRLAERVRRLLNGEPVDPSPLEYDLSGHHLGLVAHSSTARPLLRKLSAEIDGNLLAVIPGENETWAWIGARRPLDVDRVLKCVSRTWPDSTPLGIGEVAKGESGWRRSHHQARTAASVAPPGASAAVRYRDVAVIATAAKDPLLVTSLWETYLAPLAEKEGRVPLRKTLRAYFAANRNAQAASSALGVSRQTVGSRLRDVEQLLGQPLEKCADALWVALSLEELGRFPDPPDSRS